MDAEFASDTERIEQLPHEVPARMIRVTFGDAVQYPELVCHLTAGQSLAARRDLDSDEFVLLPTQSITRQFASERLDAGG